MDDCKKILLFIPCFNIGGAEYQAYRYACYLNCKHSVTIAAFDTDGPLLTKCREKEIKTLSLSVKSSLLTKFVDFSVNVLKKIFRINIWSLWKSSFALGKLIRDDYYDIVISYCAGCNAILGYSRKFFKNESVRFVWFQRDAGLKYDNEYYKLNIFKYFDLFLSNSFTGANFLKDNYNIKSCIVRNGIDVNNSLLTKVFAKNKFSISSNIVVTMVANLQHNKNHRLLLECWKILKERNVNDAVLLLAGYKGDSYHELEDFCIKNNLTDSVIFLGQVLEIPDLLQATDIFAFSSLSEGSPNSVIEACFAGLPIVSYYLPVIEEIVCEDNKEFLCFTAEDMANKLIILFKNIELRKLIGLKNKDKAMEMFNFDDNFKKLTYLIFNGGQICQK